jgi:hypothetical protein
MIGVKRYDPNYDAISPADDLAVEAENGMFVMASDYDQLHAANQRLEAQRDAILLQARCWAGEAKVQQSITREVGEILGGIPDWGPIAESVAGVVEERQRIEGEFTQLREAIQQALKSGRGTSGRIILDASDEAALRAALSTANGEVTE